MIKPVISVGFNKNGEADFEVSSAVYDLSQERLNELAEMCFAAFYAAYSMRNARNFNVGQRDDNAEAKTKNSGTGTAERAGKTSA